MNTIDRPKIALAAALALLAPVCTSYDSKAADHEILRLWTNGAPGAVGNEAADRPSLTVYQPETSKTNGTAVVICPGGAYAKLALDHEGTQVAEWLNSLGVTAFVLKYRLSPRYHHPAPLLDAQRAVRTVRARAGDWKIDPARIGLWGFSAGGHLAATAGTHFDSGRAGAPDPVDRVSSRPDFPYLELSGSDHEAPHTHAGSRDNLLGKAPDSQLVDSLCNETQVTAQTPPTFLMHTNADRVVAPENSVLFYLALRQAGVPAELHIYQQGSHGAGLATKDPVLSTWPTALAAWLGANGWLPLPSR